MMVSLSVEVATLKSEPVPPSPFRRMRWGDPAASSRIRIDPNRVPEAVGIKVTANTQLLAAAKMLPQSFVCAKSPASVPLILIWLMLRTVVPKLVSVIGIGTLVVPTF